MTCKRWLAHVGVLVVNYGLYLYAVAHIRSALGLLILAGLYGTSFLVLVSTVDLLFGRWIRRGPRQYGPQILVVPVVLQPGAVQPPAPWVVTKHGAVPASTGLLPRYNGGR